MSEHRPLPDTIKKYEVVKLGEVDPRLPYAHIVAENPELPTGDTLIDHIADTRIAELVSKTLNNAQAPIAHGFESLIAFFRYLDQHSGTGPTMGEYMIISDMIESSATLYEKFKHKLQLLGEKDVSELREANSNLFGNPEAGLFYQMLLHYLLSGIDQTRRDELINIVKSKYSGEYRSHLILSFLLKERVLSAEETKSIHDRYAMWKTREEPKYESMRAEYGSSDRSTPERLLGSFSRLAGEDLYGYQLRHFSDERDGGGIEPGIHHIGSAIHKLFGPTLST